MFGTANNKLIGFHGDSKSIKVHTMTDILDSPYRKIIQPEFVDNQLTDFLSGYLRTRRIIGLIVPYFGYCLKMTKLMVVIHAVCTASNSGLDLMDWLQTTSGNERLLCRCPIGE